MIVGADRAALQARLMMSAVREKRTFRELQGLLHLTQAVLETLFVPQ